MIRTVKHYLGVYAAFIQVCIAEATSYRLHFFLLIIMDILFYLSSIYTIDFIYDHTSAIGPWGRNEILFFISFFLAIEQIHMGFISEGFWVFSYILRKGDFDFVLLKPVNSVFAVFARHIRPSSFIMLIISFSVLIHFGLKASLSPISWFLLLPMLLLGFTLLAAVEILISCSMFWVTEGFGINFLRMQLQQVAKWPDFIYKYMARKLLTFGLPVLLIANAPVKFLIDSHQWHSIGYMVVAIFFTVLLIKFFWALGLRKYESASS